MGAEVLDLTESNPSRAGISYPAEEIVDALADALALRYDQPLLASLRATGGCFGRYEG